MIRHRIRTATGIEAVNIDPLRAIRLNCLECQGQRVYAVARCDDHFCPVYPYRLGVEPQEAKRRSRARGQESGKAAFLSKTNW